MFAGLVFTFVNEVLMARSTGKYESGQVMAVAMILLSASQRLALLTRLPLFAIVPGECVAPDLRLATRILRLLPRAW